MQNSLKWTKEAPRAEGYYWMQLAGKHKRRYKKPRGARIVELWGHPKIGMLAPKYAQPNDLSKQPIKLVDWLTLCDHMIEWAGPILEPTE